MQGSDSRIKELFRDLLLIMVHIASTLLPSETILDSTLLREAFKLFTFFNWKKNSQVQNSDLKGYKKKLAISHPFFLNSLIFQLFYDNWCNFKFLEMLASAAVQS